VTHDPLPGLPGSHAALGATWGFAIGESAIEFNEAYRDLDPMPAVILGPGSDWEHLRVRLGRPGHEREMDVHVWDLHHDTPALWAFLEAEGHRQRARFTGETGPSAEVRSTLRDELLADNPHLRAWSLERDRRRPDGF